MKKFLLMAGAVLAVVAAACSEKNEADGAVRYSVSISCTAYSIDAASTVSMALDYSLKGVVDNWRSNHELEWEAPLEMTQEDADADAIARFELLADDFAALIHTVESDFSSDIDGYAYTLKAEWTLLLQRNLDARIGSPRVVKMSVTKK